MQQLSIPASTPAPSGTTAAQRAGAVTRPSGVSGIALVQGDAASRQAPAAAPARVAANPGTPSPYAEPGLQERLGQLQQAQAYVQQLGGSLQSLKSGLSRSLGYGTIGATPDLKNRAAAVDQLWRARVKASGGQIDAQLRTVGQGEEAQQRFTLRGLDVAALAGGGAETLRLSLPGQPRPISVYFDGQGLDSHLQSLQRGLAPLGVQVAVRGDTLQFSVAESRWPSLRDGLSLMGDGQRFPGGMPLRAPLDAEPAAMAPQTWGLDEPQAQRRSLVQITQAQQQLAQAAVQLRQTLAGAATGLPSAEASAQSAEEVRQFADRFAVEHNVDGVLDYDKLRELAPALLGMQRQRVQQLLLGRND